MYSGLKQKNNLSSKALPLYLDMCLPSEHLKLLDYKMLKLLCKSTFDSAVVGKNVIKIEQELTLE